MCQDSPNSSVPNMVLSLAFAVTNPCGSNNGGCQYLCLLNAEASDGYTCACPDDLVAENNGRNCLSKQTVHIYGVGYILVISQLKYSYYRPSSYGSVAHFIPQCTWPTTIIDDSFKVKQNVLNCTPLPPTLKLIYLKGSFSFQNLCLYFYPTELTK